MNEAKETHEVTFTTLTALVCKHCGSHSLYESKARRRVFCSDVCNWAFQNKKAAELRRAKKLPRTFGGGTKRGLAVEAKHIGGAWHSIHPEGRIQWNTKTLAVGFADMMNADETSETEQVNATFSDWRGESWGEVLAQWADTGHWECVGVADFDVRSSVQSAMERLRFAATMSK